MSTWNCWRLRLVLPLVLFAGLLGANSSPGRPGEAAPATPLPAATVQQSAGRVGQSPALVGDINGDGIVDIRD